MYSMKYVTVNKCRKYNVITRSTSQFVYVEVHLDMSANVCDEYNIIFMTLTG